MADKTLNYDLSEELYNQVKAEADRLGLPVAGFMRMVAVQYFEKRLPPATENKTGGAT